jgi:tetratricopeptide (TPR) repeat protein
VTFVDGDFTGTDRFIIERRLGAGSMGAVYLAYDRELESRVALKLLLSVDASSIYRFKKEFRALADVTHPNLVTLHELFSQGDQWFFTMEYVEGKDLLAHVHGRRRRPCDSTPRPISEMPPDDGAGESIDIPVKGLEMLFPSPLESDDRLRAALVQVVEGLLAVHAAGKLHRDLKPENVMVTAEGRAVLLDFGIVVDQQKDIHETLATIIGTPAYMSPEQCRGLDVSEATDWYALGVILYETLTGDVPFDGTPMQVIARKQEVDAVPPREIVSGVPDDLNALCMQLLQRDPLARPGGEAILRALRSKRAASLPVPSEGGPRKVRAAFVGRDAPLRELHVALSVTEAGHPVVALVHGPSGIGKSTLVSRFIEMVADDEQAIVLQGRCYERESVPFKAFDNVIDSLSRYLRRLPAVDAARVLPRDIEALATLFPVLRRVDVVRRNRRPRALPPDPQELRQRAFRALKEMFSRIADLEPLVIYVDDMQWSDVDSAKLLSELVTGNDQPAVMLICVFRSGDAEQSPGLRALLDQVRSNGDLKLHELPVGVLTPEDSYALARTLLGNGPEEEGARKIGFESGGSPHVLTQLVRHVEERRSSGRASPETAKGLISFERVLGQRLGALSTDARTLLELLSVAGRPVPEVMLTLVASFNIDLSTALGELRGHKLVRGVSAHDLRAVEVYHDTIREAVCAGMTVDVLVSWHRRLAASLEASGAVDLEALTDHLLGAGDHERASLYAARAAAQAEDALAFDKAARLYGVAAEHCREPERTRELLRCWADALVAAGRGPAAAHAYVEAAQKAPPDEAAELQALAGVQLLFSGALDAGLALLEGPLPALGVGVPESFEQAAAQAAHMWRELRARGFAFTERAESEVDPRELRRLDLLWGVTRGLLLHEHERPLPLVTRYLYDALDLGEPLRIVRGLALFHVHVDLAFSWLSQLEPSGALDVAEALARRLDQVEGRAIIAFTKGLCVFHHGQIEPALQELRQAEDLYRNHCRGGAFEMRASRTMIAHLTLSIQHQIESPSSREWLREADDRQDRIGSARLRIALATAVLRADDASGSLGLLETAVEAAGGSLSGTTAFAEIASRAQTELYRGNGDGCRACYYRLDEFFTSPLAASPFERASMLLLRARLSIVARAGTGAARELLTQASAAVDEAERLGMPCFASDVQLIRASIAAARCLWPDVMAALDAVLSQPHDPKDPPLPVLCALRAKGQLIGGSEGPRMVFRAEELLAQRGVVHPRRFARLFVPGLEEMAPTLQKVQPTAT